MDLLISEANPFGGRVIDPKKVPNNSDEFSARLRESLKTWGQEGVKVVWLQLPVSHAHLVPLAVDQGFTYHHATAEWLQLTKSLEDGAYIPPFATHYIGAGGVVLTDDRKLLVIQERHHTHRHLKLPGGALLPGEHIADAVVREVEEETGVKTTFSSLVCFRHWHGYRHGKSDIYFVCRLTPLTFSITPDPTEIADCLWLPVDEYLVHPDTHEFNRRIVQAALDVENHVIQDGVALRPEEIPEYGTAESHELFFPGGQ